MVAWGYATLPVRTVPAGPTNRTGGFPVANATIRKIAAGAVHRQAGKIDC